MENKPIEKARELWQFIKKVFTHNHCDDCGFTKDQVFVAELWLEAGLILCETCMEKGKQKAEEP